MWVYPLLLAVLGLTVGSFLNAYVWRLYEGTSIRRGRSRCPECGHDLYSRDLVPVLSWLWLRGRCRYCREPISWQYPVVELATAAVFILSWLWWPLALQSWPEAMLLGLWLGISAIFVALSVYDIRWYLLPAPLLRTLFGAAVAFCVVLAATGASYREWLQEPLIGALGGFSFFYLLHILGRGRWMGGGDIKLVFILGLLVGGLGTLVGLFVAFLAGAAVGMVLLALGRKDRQSMVPFGPFLIWGFWVAFFWAEELVDWYIDMVLLL